jgi:Ca2+-binding RTX toxin-like protein
MNRGKFKFLFAALILLAGMVFAVPANADDSAPPPAASDGGSGETEGYLSQDGYMWHSNGSAGAIYPGDGLSLRRSHPRGGDYTVTRTGTGRYTVTYPSFVASYPIPTVTSYGSNAVSCKLGFFSTTETRVRCDSAAGVAADSWFTLRLTSTDDDAVGWINSNGDATFGGNRNPWGAAMSGTNPSTGSYTITVPGGPNFEGGLIMVTAYGNGANHCYSGGWSGTTAIVYCRDSAGNPVNTAFTFLYVGSEDDAHAWATDPGNTSVYTPSTAYSHNPQGNNPTSQKIGTGRYNVSFPGHLVNHGGQISVVAYGNSAADVECKIGGWSDVSAIVYCHDSSGSRTDARFNILFTRYRLCNGVPANIEIGNNLPTNGNDVIIGTANADVIAALGGNDRVCGLAGDDLIIGAAGDDTIYAGAGNDTASGNAGNDTIFGGTGDDVVYSGSGNDILWGGTGNDTLGAASGLDAIQGEAGNDTISGGSDTDGIINGGEGDDNVNGGGGDDPLVFGGTGNDNVSGNGGNDTITGGPGQDNVRGGPGNDNVFGGPDNDFLSGNDGIDVCNGEAGVDTANTNNCETILNVP